MGRREGLRRKDSTKTPVLCQRQLESDRPLLKCREAIGKGGAGIPFWLKPLRQGNQVASDKQALTSQVEDSSWGRGSETRSGNTQLLDKASGLIINAVSRQTVDGCSVHGFRAGKACSAEAS